MKTKILLMITVLTAGLMIAFAVGCNFKDQHIGVYEAVKSGENVHKETIKIELKENSKGVWRRNDEEVPFSWTIKNNELRINTKDGGTMVGKIKKKGITMILPGEEEITFNKIR